MTLTDEDLKRIIMKVGPPRHGMNPRKAIDMDRVHAMRRAGFSVGQVADYFGVNPSTIDRRLREDLRARYGLTLVADPDSH